MSDTNSFSEIEQAKLKETTLNICHLFIGDLIENSHSDRDKLWLKATIDSGIFESRVFWIRKELTAAYKVPLQQVTQTLFPDNCDTKVSEFLSNLAIAFALRNNSTDYANKARELLAYLGIEYGLIDKKLEYITLYDVVAKILVAPTVWDDGEAK
jgi:hypothetical protein